MSATVLRRMPIAIAGVVLTAGILVWVIAGGLPTAGATAAFTSSLTPVSGPIAKIVPAEAAPYTEPIRRVAAPAAKKRTQLVTSVGAAQKKRIAAPVANAKVGGQLGQARTLLAAQIDKHPILEGTTVEFGDARGYQAICYYRSGRIVISSKHTASLSTIISHEVWHVIDWRDNGRIDWGEKVPPR